jgi:hypothetical protein
MNNSIFNVRRKTVHWLSAILLPLHSQRDLFSLYLLPDLFRLAFFKKPFQLYQVSTIAIPLTL